MSGPAISKHLRVLERAGLLSREREAQWRPCRLEVAPIRAVADWTGTYQRFWEQSFDRLADYLDVLQTQGAAADRAVEQSSTPAGEGDSVGKEPSP